MVKLTVLRGEAARLRLRRERLGWTQRELALYLGVSQQVLSSWETGVCLPPLAVLDELEALEAQQQALSLLVAQGGTRGGPDVLMVLSALSDRRQPRWGRSATHGRWLPLGPHGVL